MEFLIYLWWVPFVVFMVIVAPIWIIAHYLTRWRSNKSLSSEDERLLAELWATSEKMDQRIRTLERILDSEAPHWRET